MNVVLEKKFIVHKVKAGTIYKLLLIGMLFSTMPLGLIVGVAGYFGADVVSINGEVLHGVKAIFGGLGISIVISLIFSVFFGSLVCFGLWLFSLIKPLSIRIVSHSPPA